MADIESEMKECREKLDNVLNATGTKEMEKLMSQTHAKDVRLFHPWGEVCTGHEEIRRSLLKLFKGYRLKSEAVETLYEGGDTVGSLGRWILYGNDGSIIDSGNDNCVFKKISGRWFLQEDTYVSEKISLKDELMQMLLAWSKTLEEGDYEKAADFFTPYCTYMTDKRPPLKGRKALAEEFRKSVKDGGECGSLVFDQNVEIRVVGENLATLRGHNVLQEKDGRVTCHAQYLLTFKRLEDGKWYIHHDLWSQLPE